jgi:hypothetical protein
MIRDIHPRSRIRILIFHLFRIPDPGVKKAPDPGSGSATLQFIVSGSVADPDALNPVPETDPKFLQGRSFLLHLIPNPEPDRGHHLPEI